MTLTAPTVRLSNSALILAAETACQPVWQRLAAVEYTTFDRVLDAFTRNRVGSEHFPSVTGYGHDDMGREATDRVFAHALQAEAALVRPTFASGTHALSVALNGCLRPGDRLLILTGAPYDTLEEVLGLRGDHPLSLVGRGISVEIHSPWDETGRLRADWPTAEAEAAIRQADACYYQRSRGYSLDRETLTVDALGGMIAAARQINPNALHLVDNCYGEFTQAQEPTALGADLMAGSLIKNPGGGIVPAGGYVAGREDLVERCATALTCPGVGRHGGYTFDLNRILLQGLFLAPSAVRNALQGMTLAAYAFEQAGYETTPRWDATRSDIIQVIRLGSPEAMVQFCKAVQALSPIDSALTPEPAVLPGYADPVVMAGGTFIEGSTLELSADGPLRPPYVVYFQGGLTYAHTRRVVATLLGTDSPLQ